MSEVPKSNQEQIAKITQGRGEEAMRYEPNTRRTLVERAVDLLSSDQGRQNLLGEMQYRFNDFLSSVEEGRLCVLIPSKGQKEARAIVESLKNRFGQDHIVVFDFSGLLGESISSQNVEQKIEELSESSFSNGKIVLLHPETSLSGDALLWLRAVVSHEKAFERNQAILVTNLKEFDRKGEDDFVYGGSYARNIYAVVNTELDLGRTPLEFDKTKAERTVKLFCDAFRALKSRNTTELYFEPRAGKSTLIKSFGSWWIRNIDPLMLDSFSLMDTDFHEFYGRKTDPFEGLCKWVEFRAERRDAPALILIDEAQDLTEEQKQKLARRFPEQKFFLIGHG